MAEGSAHAVPPTPSLEIAYDRVESFLLDELMFGADRSDLRSGVRLVSDGVLDSMAILRLIYFLEATFGVTIPPDQMTADHLDSVELILGSIERNAAPARKG